MQKFDWRAGDDRDRIRTATRLARFFDGKQVLTSESPSVIRKALIAGPFLSVYNQLNDRYSEQRRNACTGTYLLVAKFVQ